MKNRAFTMLELVIVVVTVGILTAAALPRLERNSVVEAAEQVAAHIRYTQHLAMMEDKFCPNDAIWFRRRWQLMFVNNTGSAHQWAYIVFSDRLGKATGNPDISETAVNPLNHSRRLSGGTSGNELINTDDPLLTPELNIGIHYKITSVTRSNCGRGNLRISFDHMGRPLVGALQSLDTPYTVNGNSRLLTNTPCVITLSNGEEKASIAIEPETGYVHRI